MVFSHVNYESRIINMEEVRDTVYLISKLLNVKEVVVFGKAKLRSFISVYVLQMQTKLK